MSNAHGRINRRQEVDDLIDYVNNGWLRTGEFDGPTFLWNHLIREASQRTPKIATMYLWLSFPMPIT